VQAPASACIADAAVAHSPLAWTIPGLASLYDERPGDSESVHNDRRGGYVDSRRIAPLCGSEGDGCDAKSLPSKWQRRDRGRRVLRGWNRRGDIIEVGVSFSAGSPFGDARDAHIDRAKVLLGRSASRFRAGTICPHTPVSGAHCRNLSGIAPYGAISGC
jgi:hypothetical protein